MKRYVIPAAAATSSSTSSSSSDVTTLWDHVTCLRRLLPLTCTYVGMLTFNFLCLKHVGVAFFQVSPVRKGHVSARRSSQGTQVTVITSVGMGKGEGGGGDISVRKCGARAKSACRFLTLERAKNLQDLTFIEKKLHGSIMVMELTPRTPPAPANLPRNFHQCEGPEPTIRHCLT